MIKRLVAIGLIFGCTTIAWMVLGGTISARTYSSDTQLKAKVERIWGTVQTQWSPGASYTVVKQRKEASTVDNKEVIKIVKYTESRPIPLMSSDIKTDIALDHRQKGLLWYATYAVDFSASYQFKNDTKKARRVKIVFPFPSQTANYDDFRFELRERPWSNKPEPREGSIHGIASLQPGEAVTLDVAYRSQGLNRWGYQFGQGISEIRNFRLVMQTNFAAIDFPDDSISPGDKHRTEDGWRLTWEFKNLISGVAIGMLMPQKLQPGPLAGEISFFAPISLFFFIVVMLVITLIKRVDLHPMHFFFLSAAFFSFHLLLAYLVDHISIHLAFVIASAVSLILVTSYMRIVVGTRLAFLETASAQLIYLILFSYAFFFKGLTGLAITIGAVMTLFVMMQMTARVDWQQVFRKTASGMWD